MRPTTIPNAAPFGIWPARRRRRDGKTGPMQGRLCPIVVGRDAELDTLAQALSSAAAGKGRCAVLVGEPGIGKSRLVREASARASAMGFAVAAGRAVPGSGSPAFRPVADALARLLRDHELPEDKELAPWLPALAPLLDVAANQDSHAVSLAEVAPSVRGEALLRLVRRVAPAGAVIVLEDLHWADADTVSLVEYLADSVDTEKLVLMITLRDGPATAALEMTRRLRAAAGVVHITLMRLSPEQAATMARACLPGATTDDCDQVAQVAEGVPLLVEELLASPGIPASFAATVEARLADLGDSARRVVEAAAILGRDFDWQLLSTITGQPEEEIRRAIVAAVESLVFSTQTGQVRFRHALTREAVLDTVIPPDQRALAASALDVLVASRPVLDAGDRQLAIDLAVRAGDRRRAGIWLVEAGRRAVGWGALGNATEAFRRAADLLDGYPEQSEAELLQIEALAHSGRVEDTAAAGGRLLKRLGSEPDDAIVRVRTHLHVARAAVAASRWQMAKHHLDAARQLSGAVPPPGFGPQIAVLEADVCIALDDYEEARRLAEVAAGADGADAEVRCHAFEIIGRTRRPVDLQLARRAFESALVISEAAGLPLWRLRALHELGTVDLYEHAGVTRLHEARRSADEAGALSTAAVLDLQLAAAYTCRWDLEACDARAHSAIAIAERLGLYQVRAKALALLTGSAGMRADLDATAHYAALTMSAAPEDPMLEGFCWGMRGMALLLSGDTDASIEPYARGMDLLSRLPHAEPAALRALWPLLLASRSDRRAGAAVDEARLLRVDAFGLNRAMIGYARALLAADRGDHRQARALAAESDPGFANCEGWADLARLLAAPAAATGDWADFPRWLNQAAPRFSERGLPVLADRAKQLLARCDVNPWSELGVTSREADVLRLLCDGLANKDIAAELHLSRRTVEKHVEALLRKSGTRSRTELAARLAGPAGPAGPAGQGARKSTT
jgi:DNA-binding CsgD family transcriptional regulator